MRSENSLRNPRCKSASGEFLCPRDWLVGSLQKAIPYYIHEINMSWGTSVVCFPFIAFSTLTRFSACSQCCGMFIYLSLFCIPQVNIKSSGTEDDRKRWFSFIFLFRMPTHFINLYGLCLVHMAWKVSMLLCWKDGIN